MRWQHWMFWVVTLTTIFLVTRFKDQIAQKLFDWAVRLPKIKRWVGTVLCAELCDILVSLMREGDVVVIAGKGHEQGQIVGGVVHPFDDAAEATEALKDHA